MNKFDQLNNLLIKPKICFDILSKQILNRNIIKLANDILIEYEINDTINPRVFLSIWVINYCADDIFSKEKKDKYSVLISIANNILNNLNNFNKDDILLFNEEFKKYKEQDKNDLMNEILLEYHKLTIEEAHASKELTNDMIEIITKCKMNLLETAKQIGGLEFVNYIKSYKSIVFDPIKVLEQYNKAYWDLVNQYYTDHDFNNFYEQMYQILHFIKDLLLTIGPSKINNINQILDIDYIKQRVDNNAYDLNEIILLVNNILNIIKSLQSPMRDNDLEQIRQQINNNELILPKILEHLVIYCNNIIEDIYNLRND